MRTGILRRIWPWTWEETRKWALWALLTTAATWIGKNWLLAGPLGIAVFLLGLSIGLGAAWLRYLQRNPWRGKPRRIESAKRRARALLGLADSMAATASWLRSQDESNVGLMREQASDTWASMIAVLTERYALAALDADDDGEACRAAMFLSQVRDGSTMVKVKSVLQGVVANANRSDCVRETAEAAVDEIDARTSQLSSPIASVRATLVEIASDSNQPDDVQRTAQAAIGAIDAAMLPPSGDAS